jgi:hypothetical protein
LFKFSAIAVAFLECLCGSKKNPCPYLEFRQNLKRDSASKTRKKRLSLILYSEMVKKSSGSVSEGDHQQRNNMVSFSIRIIHMSRIGSCCSSAAFQIRATRATNFCAKMSVPIFFAIGNGQRKKRKNLIKPV